jgi:hypothetical protein
MTPSSLQAALFQAAAPVHELSAFMKEHLTGCTALSDEQQVPSGIGSWLPVQDHFLMNTVEH